jgi:hypothetical protein
MYFAIFSPSLCRHREPRDAMKNHLDFYLLELILMDTIATMRGRYIPGAERIIQSYIPKGLYERIIERHDQLTADLADDDPRYLELWYKVASGQPSRWKRKMIGRFLSILRAGGAIGAPELADIAALAATINATREWRRMLSLTRASQHPFRQTWILQTSTHKLRVSTRRWLSPQRAVWGMFFR